MTIRQKLASTMLAACTALLFSNPVNAADNFVRISDGNKFNQLVVGRKLYLDENYVVVNKNGSLKGKFGGKTLKGAWEWRDGYWCRTLTTHSKDTDCQLWEVNGNQFIVTRDRGKGKGFTYIAK